jgi:hypothetical protein
LHYSVLNYGFAILDKLGFACAQLQRNEKPVSDGDERSSHDKCDPLLPLHLPKPAVQSGQANEQAIEENTITRLVAILKFYDLLPTTLGPRFSLLSQHSRDAIYFGVKTRAKETKHTTRSAILDSISLDYSKRIV